MYASAMRQSTARRMGEPGADVIDRRRKNVFPVRHGWRIVDAPEEARLHGLRLREPRQEQRTDGQALRVPHALLGLGSKQLVTEGSVVTAAANCKATGSGEAATHPPVQRTRNRASLRPSWDARSTSPRPTCRSKPVSTETRSPSQDSWARHSPAGPSPITPTRVPLPRGSAPGRRMPMLPLGPFSSRLTQVLTSRPCSRRGGGEPPPRMPGISADAGRLRRAWCGAR